VQEKTFNAPNVPSRPQSALNQDKSMNTPQICVPVEAAPPLNVARLRGVTVGGNLADCSREMAGRAYRTSIRVRPSLELIEVDQDVMSAQIGGSPVKHDWQSLLPTLLKTSQWETSN
jgi:hypothetical protein